jgi:hypothetical protein
VRDVESWRVAARRVKLSSAVTAELTPSDGGMGAGGRGPARQLVKFMPPDLAAS